MTAKEAKESVEAAIKFAKQQNLTRVYVALPALEAIRRCAEIASEVSDSYDKADGFPSHHAVGAETVAVTIRREFGLENARISSAVMADANNLIYDAAVAASKLPSVSGDDVAEILERAAREQRAAMQAQIIGEAKGVQ